MPPDILAKRFFAKTYQWTEEQVEEASLDALVWFPKIEEAEDYATRIKQRREQKAQKGRQF